MLNALKRALCVALVGVAISAFSVPASEGDGEKPGDPTVPAPPPPDSTGG